MNGEQMEQERAYKRFLELARRAERCYAEQYTRFLDPAGRETALRAADEAGISVLFWGGYSDAERVMACFGAETSVEWPITWLKLGFNPRYGTPGHRDILGALMGLGVVREHLGDIVLDTDCAYLCCSEEIAPFLQNNLESAGSVHLKLTQLDEPPHLPPPVGKMIRTTVASPRLDAMLAAGFDLSREQARQMVIQGKTRVNYRLQVKPDAGLQEGDLVSVRGLGRFKLMENNGTTRKGRDSMTLFRYGGR
jgi:RNA-binding protein YlmH